MVDTLEVTCPKCGYKLDLSEAVQEELKRNIQADVRKELDVEKSQELNELQEELESKSKEISEFRKNELELRRQKRELEEKSEDIDLEIARRLDEERKQIAKEATYKAEEEYRLKLKESENQLTSLRDELTEVKRKADQGSQQLHGEIAELDLEDLLKSNFPHDLISPVGKGIRGADVHQRVQTPDGQFCGTIIWESKNTKNWTDRWISKLKEDQLTAKADLAVLVSVALPEDVQHFSSMDGIWVTGFPYAISLAKALRETLIEVARAHRSLQGKDEKIEHLYNYLSGPEFKQRIEMIVNTFITMKTELDSEKRAMTKLWSQREKSIDKVINNVAGMYGDLQGIIGAALPTIQTLELPEPEGLLEE